MREGGSEEGVPGAPAPSVPTELVVVGPDRTDASFLVLTGPDGARFRLRAGSELRRALRELGPATGALTPVAPPLRPRDIQARIRAGESAADVAAAAGVPVEQVRRYEGPVLAERAHMAVRAREAPVRAEGDRRRLVDLVRIRLTTRGVDPATVAWDAWRRDEARWAVQAVFRAAGRERHAQWAFDPATSTLEALDDEARWLSAVQEAAPRTGRRLAAVRVYDVEDDGGVREVTDVSPSMLTLGAFGDAAGIDEVVEPELADPEDVAARTMELLDALRDRRGRRMPVMDLGDDDMEGWEDDEDDLVNALLDLPPAAHPPMPFDDVELVEPPLPPEPRLRMVPSPPPRAGEDPTGPIHEVGDHLDERDDLDQQHADRSDRRPPTVTASQVPEDAPTAPGPRALPRPPPHSSAVLSPAQDERTDDEDGPPAPRARRPVPSWDEILFGGPRLD